MVYDCTKKAGFINNSHGNTTQTLSSVEHPSNTREIVNMLFWTLIECLTDFPIISCASTNSHHLKKYSFSVIQDQIYIIFVVLKLEIP